LEVRSTYKNKKPHEISWGFVNKILFEKKSL
jgi:hypothetical protein